MDRAASGDCWWGSGQDSLFFHATTTGTMSEKRGKAAGLAATAAPAFSIAPPYHKKYVRQQTDLGGWDTPLLSVGPSWAFELVCERAWHVSAALWLRSR